MSRRRGNESGLGTFSHPEMHREIFIKKDTKQKSRNKCIHYDFETKTCRKLIIGCVGPSNPFCKDYCEETPKANSRIKSKDSDATEQSKNSFNNTSNRCVLFYRIKQVKLEDIQIDKIMKRPSSKKEREVYEYYREKGEFDKPIVLSLKNGKYYLEDGFARYCVAKRLELESVPAILNTIENKDVIELYKIGRKVRHKVFGEGAVVSVSLKEIKMYFPFKDETKRFDPCDTCSSSACAPDCLFLLFSLSLIFLLRYLRCGRQTIFYCTVGGLSFLLIGIAFFEPRA